MKLGINNNISNNDYHGDRKYASSSALKMMLRDPERYYKLYILGQKEAQKNTVALDFGSYAHTIVLEPDLVHEEYAFYPGNIRRGKEYTAFKEANPDKTIIMPSQVILGEQIIKSVAGNSQAVACFENGVPEQTLCTKIDGYKIKVRCDYLRDNDINDLKTTSGGTSRDEVINSCLKYDYDLSAALYVDAFEAQTGEKHNFNFIFVDKKSMECQVYKASEQFLENGRKKYKDAIKLLNLAKETGVYFNEKTVKELYIPESAIWRGL